MVIARWNSCVLEIVRRPGASRPWWAVWRDSRGETWKETDADSWRECAVRAMLQLRLHNTWPEVQPVCWISRWALAEAERLLAEEKKQEEERRQRELEAYQRRLEARAQLQALAGATRWRKDRCFWGTEVRDCVSAGGLAVVRDDRMWYLVHRASGLLVNRRGFPTRRLACEVAAVLLQLPVDWTLPAEELSKLPREARAQVAEVFGDHEAVYARMHVR